MTPQLQQRLAIATAAFVALAGLVASIVFPVLIHQSDTAASTDSSDSVAAARQLVAAFSSNLLQMRHAMHLTVGFVMSAAPLKAPTYFSTANATQRQQQALDLGNPSAMSQEAYDRLRSVISSRLPYVNQIGIAPGFVNWRSNSSYKNIDLYAFRPYEFDWMAANITVSVPPPLTYFLYYRTPIFNVSYEELNHDPWAIDPATGHHPNFRYMWGSVTTGLDAGMTFAGAKPEDIIGPSRRAYLYAKAHVYVGSVSQPRIVLGVANGATGNETAACHADLVEVCITEQHFTFLCVRVWSITPAHRLTASEIGTIAALCVLLPLVVVATVLVIVQCYADRADNHLQFLPHGPPFFVVSVDLCDASQLWTEIPHAAAAAVKTLSRRATAAAKENQLYVAQTIGSTIVVIGSHPRRVIQYARSMVQWASAGADLPPEILGLFPDSRVALSAILHYSVDATIHRTTNDDGVETATILCEDFWLLLSMRAAAVPHNVIATSHFITAATTPQATAPSSNEVSFRNSVNNTSGGEARSSATRVEMGTTDATPLVTGVKRLGVCCAQPRLNAPGIDVEGYLIRLQNGTNLDAVYDSIPERVMVEWRLNATQSSPLNPTAGFNESGAGASHSRMMSRTGATEMYVLAESEGGIRTAAPPSVPGCAVEYHDARKLVGALLDVGAGATKLSKSVSNSTTPTSRRLSTANEHAFALRPLTSLASYHLCALRIIFAPLDAETRQAVISRICTAVGVPMSDDSLFHIAARCASLGYEDFAPTVSPTSSPRLGMPSHATLGDRSASPDPEDLLERQSPIEATANNPLRVF